MTTPLVVINVRNLLALSGPFPPSTGCSGLFRQTGSQRLKKAIGLARGTGDVINRA